MPPEQEEGAIALAERLLGLLDQGAFTATYKYAVLLGLLDLCLENTARTGLPPTTLTTRQLAEKVFELYWPHVVPHASGAVLQQTTHRRASILSRVESFRTRVERRTGRALPLLGRARAADPDGYESSIRDVEWTLIEYPLVRLQRVGRDEVRFLYEIDWDEDVRKALVRRYQHRTDEQFSNAIRLRPRVGEYLVQLNGLLRPIIHRLWSAKVARINRLEEAKLEEFLFGSKRVALSVVRRPLLELQDGKCFYCDREITDTPEVDHFLPWSRYPSDALDNLVVADRRCNSDKRDFLAASVHVHRWARRTDGDVVSRLAAELDWDFTPSRSLSVARAVYLRLPDEVRLWAQRDTFVPLDRTALVCALT